MPKRNNSIRLALHAILYLSPGCHSFMTASPSHANFHRRSVPTTFVGRNGRGRTFDGSSSYSSSAAVAATAASDVDRDLNDLSVTELKRLLSDRGVDFRDCLEKRELVERLKSSGSSNDPVRPRRRLNDAERERIDTFKRVSPCVANIKTVQLVPDQRGLRLRGTEVPTGSGSGFLWDDKGHVVTNYHVVASGASGRRNGNNLSLPNTVKVKLAGASSAVDAEIVGVEPEKDLAVLRMTGDLSKLPAPIDVGTSNDLQVGQSVTAIGNPFGLDDTLTTGIVSALGRDVDGVGGRPIHGCVQTDAAINPGNSGGPLLDSSGRLIGVNTAIFSPNGSGNVGIGFAIPVDTVRRVVNQIIQYGRVVRPTLGLSVVEDRLVRAIENQIGRPLDGCLVAEVVPGGPAETARVEASVFDRYGSVVLGDLVVALNGEPVGRAEDLISAVEERNDGDVVELDVWRKCDPRKVEKIKVRLTTRDRLERTARQKRIGYGADANASGMTRPASRYRKYRRFVPW